MKLEINLADIEFCEGCPCLYFDKTEENVCGKGYPVPENSVYECDGSRKWTARPEKCKEENGE